MDFLRRNYQAFFPPQPPKTPDALRCGILGAANIAPSAFILPAKSHPEVIVQGVAARDLKKAAAYAKKHGIPQVYGSYTELIDDSTIDAVYIPLPNGLHFEWALRALAKGKHVLLEKPSVSNADEAELLFRSLLLTTPRVGAADGDSRPPVLLEAFHYRFQPAWLHLLSLVDRPNIATVHAEALVPGFIFSKDDIRFRYDLAGGSIMDLGTYPMSALRQVLGVDPEACVSCTVQKCDPPAELCDFAAEATFRFPGGVLGTAKNSLRASLSLNVPFVRVEHKAVPVATDGASGVSASDGKPMPAGYECVVARTLTLHNFMVSNIWHRLDIEDAYAVRRVDDPDNVLRRWRVKTTKKIYTFADAGITDQPGPAYWLSYRHQLEQFVNRVRGRPGSGAWVSHDDSIAQARMLDMAYAQSDLPLRPTSTYRPAVAEATEAPEAVLAAVLGAATTPAPKMTSEAA